MAEVPGAVFVGGQELLPLSPDFFATDGFHPGADGYRRWAEAIAGQVAFRAGG